MTTDAPGALDPLIHIPTRLRIVATLAALPDGDTVSFPRLHDMTGLTPANLITCLRVLANAGYVQTETTASGASTPTTVALTHDGRGALDRYAAALRHLPTGAASEDHLAPGPDLRIGDADRDAAAAALGEHFAQGRLTLDELGARLDAAFTATTQSEISQATWDLPDLTLPSSSRGERAGRRRRPGPPASQRTPPRQRGCTRGKYS